MWQKQFLGLSRTGERKATLGLVYRFAEMVLSLVPIVVAWYIAAADHGQLAKDVPWWAIVTVLAACLVLQLLLSYKGQVLCFTGGYEIVVAFRRAAARHMRRLPMSYFLTHRSGAINALLTDDVKKVEDYFTHFLAELILSVAMAVFILALMLAIDFRLAWAAVILIPVGAFIGVRIFRVFLGMHDKQLMRYKKLSAKLVEFAEGIQTLKVYQRFNFITGPLYNQILRIKNSSMGLEIMGGKGVLVFRLCVELGVPMMFAIASILWSESEVTSTWILVFLLAYCLIHVLIDLSLYFALSLVSDQSGHAIDTYMNHSPFVAEGRTEDAGGAAADEVLAVKDVSFAYQKGGDPIIDRMSFAVKKGTVTAITGRSGCGKSTLLNLISCFYRPDQGEIYLDGRSYAQLGSEAIYRELGVVFQDSFVFAGTVLDNVKLGNEEATRGQVIEACRAAHCHDVFASLPDGYDTRIGQGGVPLSGGERQRLTIARMLVKDPAIIIVDEMTSQLDPINQYQVQMALSRLAHGRTVIVVAHRLHTIQSADQILLLDKGRIAEQGTHDQLVARNGLYHKLWQKQKGDHSLPVRR